MAVSETVAVHVVAWAMSSEVSAQLTVVVVVRAETDSSTCPWLERDRYRRI